jgi:hypothetical protein
LAVGEAFGTAPIMSGFGGTFPVPAALSACVFLTHSGLFLLHCTLIGLGRNTRGRKAEVLSVLVNPISTAKGPPPSPVQLRSAVWTGGAPDTTPNSDSYYAQPTRWFCSWCAFSLVECAQHPGIGRDGLRVHTLADRSDPLALCPSSRRW